MEFGTIIANFIASSFGCKPDETKQLINMAKVNFQYQINNLYKLHIPIPKYITIVNVNFTTYYNKFLKTLME